LWQNWIDNMITNSLGVTWQLPQFQVFNLKSSAVFFSPGSANSSLGYLKMLKIVIFWTFRFRQMLIHVSKVQRLEKGRKTLISATIVFLESVFHFPMFSSKSLTSSINRVRSILRLFEHDVGRTSGWTRHNTILRSGNNCQLIL